MSIDPNSSRADPVTLEPVAETVDLERRITDCEEAMIAARLTGAPTSDALADHIEVLKAKLARFDASFIADRLGMTVGRSPATVLGAQQPSRSSPEPLDRSVVRRSP